MAKTPYPEWFVPLSKSELEELGYFNAVWSQIDLLITMLLGALAKAPLLPIIDMTGGATTGARVAMLRKLAERGKDTELVKACRDMGKALGIRNHLAHGVWGVRIPSKGKAPVASCHHQPSPHSPFDANRLHEAIDLACAASYSLGKVWRRVSKNPTIGSNMFYFGDDDPPPGPGPDYPVTLREDVGSKS